MARQRGGRPWGPVRAESTEAEALAVFLRAQVDFSGKTLKVLEGEILHSKAKISEHLGGRVPDLAFVTALIRATIPEPQLRNRRLTEARELLQAAAHPSPRQAPPPSATALELAEVRTQQVEVYDRLTRSLEQQNELREAAGNSAKLVMVLLSMISSLKRTITDLTSERDQLRAARATPDTLQQTQQQLARAREQDARARQELEFAQDKQRQAEELATQVQARVDQLTDELDRLRTAATVPAAVGEDEMPAGRRAEPVSSGDPVGDDIDQALDQVAAVNEHDDQMLQRITHDLVRDVLPAERVVPDNPQDPVPRRRLGAVTDERERNPSAARWDLPADVVDDSGRRPRHTGPGESPGSERTVQQKQTTPRIWGNIPPRNPNFIGRSTLLTLLEQEAQGRSLTQAVVGMGGVGKTQLAIEYAYRHQSEYDIVWWIPAERPGQVGQALVELAQRLGLGTGGEANIAGPAVREALREGRPYSRWLLIFDNADSPERVRDYFPTGGSGTILVTSRNRRWNIVGPSLEVDVFTREESKRLLRRSSAYGEELADTDADLLADALGDLPLALEQAAAWRVETGMPVSEYLRLFEHKRSELLEVSPPPDYQLPVAAAWNVSLDHLETRSLTALRLLQLCSYFAPAPIPRSIFTGLRGSSIDPELDRALDNPLRLGRAIREINRYSLARMDHRTNSIEMHRLVQKIVIARMTPEEQARMRHGAHTLLANIDPKVPHDPAHWPRYAELYGHVVASGALESDLPWVRELVQNTAEYLFLRGDHHASLGFAEQAWESWLSRFGDEDRQTQRMGQRLCFVSGAVGRFADATRLATRLKKVHERTAHPDGHIEDDAVDILQLEAAVRRAEGKFTLASELDQSTYEQAVQAFGEDDPIVVRIRDSLAASRRLMGHYQQALELDQHTLVLKLRLFGALDRRTLATQNNVAIDMRETGDHSGARALHETVRDTCLGMLGPQNPATIEATYQLSESCLKWGDPERALELAVEAHTQSTQRYGDNHPQSLNAALTLSVALRHNGYLEAARTRGVVARENCLRVYGPHHPHALSANAGLAITLRMMGDPEEAQRLDETTLASLTDQLGDSHPLALVHAVNLATDLAAVGQHEVARRQSEGTLALCTESLGTDHPITLACSGNLSMDLASTGSEAEGVALRESTLARMERTLDTSRAGRDPHPATVQLRNHLRADCDIAPLPL